MRKPTFLATIIFFFLSTISISVLSQNHEEHEHHLHHNNEISIAAGVLSLGHESGLSSGLHLHYVRGVALENKLGIGAGFETIFDEHKHHTFSAVIQYRIIKGWTVAYAPGVLLLKESEDYETQFAQHIETAYEFDLGKFHLGPMAEIGIEKHGIHYMLGVHFGLDF